MGRPLGHPCRPPKRRAATRAPSAHHRGPPQNPSSHYYHITVQLYRYRYMYMYMYMYMLVGMLLVCVTLCY